MALLQQAKGIRREWTFLKAESRLEFRAASKAIGILLLPYKTELVQSCVRVKLRIIQGSLQIAIERPRGFRELLNVEEEFLILGRTTGLLCRSRKVCWQ